MESNQTPSGYPLSYFANTPPFDRLLSRFAKYEHSMDSDSATIKRGGKKLAEPLGKVPAWAHRVWLTECRTKRHKPTDSEDKRGKGKDSGQFEYTLTFVTDTCIRILLEQPRGVIVLFGGNGRAPMTLRLGVDARGRAQRFEAWGDVRFRLPRGLVSAVVRSGDRWVLAQPRHIEVPLGDARVCLARGQPPRLSQPLTFPLNTLARIGQSPIVARLGRLDLTGSHAKPRLSFLDIEMITERSLQHV